MRFSGGLAAATTRAADAGEPITDSGIEVTGCDVGIFNEARTARFGHAIVVCADVTL